MGSYVSIDWFLLVFFYYYFFFFMVPINDLALTNMALHWDADHIDTNVLNETHVTNDKPLILAIK